MPPPLSVAIIGGGLAGLASAEAASRCGFRVELFEQSGRLGGRAGSFVEPATQRLVDFCPHVAMGCCTNFLEFCRQTGIADGFRREKTLHFFGPDARRCDFTPSRWLPAPFHLLPSLNRLAFLSPAERRGIRSALLKLCRTRAVRSKSPTTSYEACSSCGESTSDATDTTFGKWLREQNQSENAVQRFWSVVIVGALSETVDYVSLAAARKVFSDGFLSARSANELILPSVPLSELFDRRVGQSLTDRKVTIRRRERVHWIEREEDDRLSLILPEGESHSFDAVIVAVPWHQASGLFPLELLEEIPELTKAETLASGSILAVHLWFDRPLTSLPHAVMVGKLAQWIFRGNVLESKSASKDDPTEIGSDFDLPKQETTGSEHFYQVVISAGHRLDDLDKERLLPQVLAELNELFPDARSARLVHSRLVTQPQAVFTVTPGTDRKRPSASISFPSLFLAGDWTATGWPATMEGAVRSGYRAVEALLESHSRPSPLLVPDLPRAFWVRKLLG